MLALVIDDSRALRVFLRRILVERGFEVVEAAGAHEYVLKPFTSEAITDEPSLLGLPPAA